MAIYTKLQKDDVQQIADSYSLSLTGFEPMEGGSSNTTYLLHTSQGACVLTVFEDAGFIDVTRIGRVLSLLERHGFPSTPPLASVAGNLTTMHLGKPVILKKYIDGQVREDLDVAMLTQVGAAMARLHQIPAPDFLLDECPHGRQAFTRVIGQGVNLEYESWLAQRSAYLADNIPARSSRGLIHADLFGDNILFEDGKLKAILDFADACYYYKGYDLGMGIVGLCTQDATVAFDKVRALTAGYQEVRILEEVEREALQLFVEYAAISITYWRFWKFNIHTPIAEKACRYKEMVGLAEAVGAIPKTRFLEAVFL